jgi:type III pantothenate kinase
MNIAVDIGNTRTKVSVHDGASIIWDAVFDKTITKQGLNNILAHNPTRGIISAVGSSSVDFTRLLPQIEWIELHHELNFPFASDYKTPKTLGLDRLALVAAGVKSYPEQHVLIIDAGTCVTYDLVTRHAQYKGGAISPGLNMRLKSMHHFTEKLPLVPVYEKAAEIGESTQECLQSGALNGLAAEIDGMITRYEKQFAPLQVVLTGGDAKVLAPLIKNNIFARPKFLLEGLHAILAYNTP